MSLSFCHHIFFWKFDSQKKRKIYEQAGAELAQARPKRWLCIDWNYFKQG